MEICLSCDTLPGVKYTSWQSEDMFENKNNSAISELKANQWFSRLLSNNVKSFAVSKYHFLTASIYLSF